MVPEEGAPRSIAIVQGGTQSGTAGQPLPVPLIVEVKDDVGRPVAQQPLTIALEQGGGITPSQPVTNSAGRATFTWTLGPAVGTQELSVATAVDGPSVTFHGNASAATANVVTIIAGNGQSGQAGKPLADSLVIRVRDEFGNPVEDAVVTWTTGQGSVSPTGGTTDTDGFARTRWTLGPGAGSQTATASVAGVPNPVTFGATATPGPTPTLVINRQPSDKAKSGETLMRQPRIQLQDGEGNNLSTGGVTVTATLNGPGGALSGPTTKTTGGNGRADFMDLAITGPSGKYTITFSASGYTSVTSEDIELENRPVSPTSSTFTADSSVLEAGHTTALRARIVDADGNPLPGITVTFGITGSGHTLQQPGQPTGADGVATGSLTATTSGARTLIASVGNLQLADNVV
ncbi:MAG TPA: Ig-like domain-containing protein, partial [Gemmatimonadales bacterium]|nr:Ig-like domain-containing protein [Gemmatimonadales bacterium]